MKILALNPPSRRAGNVVRDVLNGSWCKGRRIGGATLPPYNLLLVATVLGDDGHRVRLWDAPAEGRTRADLIAGSGEFDAVVLATSSMTINEDAEMLSRMKERRRRLRTVVFGAHPTFMPRQTLDRKGIDIIVMGEPEFAIRDLARSLGSADAALKNIRGIGYRDDGRAVLNDPYPLIQDLDELPFPDRGLLPHGADYFNPLVRRMPYTTAVTSRGCPAECTFCTAPYYYGRKLRCRSAENVMEELRSLARRGYKEVYFRDETFTSFPERNRSLCAQMIKEKLGLLWICNGKIGTVDKDAEVDEGRRVSSGEIRRRVRGAVDTGQCQEGDHPGADA